MCAVRTLIVSEHLPTGYSGGRYHSWMMAEALAAGGAEVTVWTNAKPFLMRDFVSFPAHGRIELHVDPLFRTAPAGSFDVIFLVPSLGLDWSVFAAAVETAAKQGARLVFLDFEAPSWYNTENAKQRSWFRVLPWKLASRHADVILSTTALGSMMAREYYQPASGASAFRQCYCAINSVASDQAQAEQQDQIICITRLDKATPHKGAADLLSLMCDQLKGFRVVVIGSVPSDLKNRLAIAAEKHGMTFVSKKGLTDVEKFTEIKSSRLMVFLSRFEGFGYPPLEALYSGVPCITRPLPVLRETGGEHLHYLSEGESLPEAVVRVLSETGGLASGQAREAAARVAKFEHYVERMASLVAELSARPRHRKSGGSYGGFLWAARTNALMCRGSRGLYKGVSSLVRSSR